jgi:cell division protein FtsB
MRRVLWAVVSSLGFIAVVFLFVLPTRTYYDQHRALNQVSSQLATLRSEDQRLESQAASLAKKSTVARIAHDDYGLLAPGQQATVVLPSPRSSQPSPTAKKQGTAGQARPGSKGAGQAAPPASGQAAPPTSGQAAPPASRHR